MKAPWLLAILVLSCGRTDASAAAPGLQEPPAAAREDDLEQLFERADRDPAGLVPLILEASARIGTLDGERGHALANRLEPYCHRAFFTPERPPGMDRLGLAVHTVRSGELPGRIARRYSISPQLLAYLNEGYDERRLQVGARLKVLDNSNNDLALLVDRTRYRLAAWGAVASGAGPGEWALIAYLPVGLGAPETRTPTGATKVTLRVLDPEWTHPVTGEVFAPDHPDNVLGGYWMALDEEGIGKSGIGLHGYTGDRPEAWLEKPMSNGCIRLRQEDMDRIFHLAVEGTSLSIGP